MPIKRRQAKARNITVTPEAAEQWRRVVEALRAETEAIQARMEAERTLVRLLAINSRPWLTKPPWQDHAPASVGSTGMAAERYEEESEAYQLFTDLNKAAGMKLETYYSARYRGEKPETDDAA